MVNIKTKFPRGIELSEALPCVREAALSSSLDQVISLTLADGCNGSVHPGPGLKLRHGGLTPEASGTKHQASSFRTNLVEHQATSI